MSTLPEWAVIGAEIVSDGGGVEKIVRVSKTSAWSNSTGVSDTQDTRWVSAYGDSLKRYGAQRWDRNFAYPTDREPGKRLKRTAILRGHEQKIRRLTEKVGVRVNGQENLEKLEEAAGQLFVAVSKYRSAIATFKAEDRVDAEEAK